MYRIPYDRGHLAFDLPAGMRGTLVESHPAEPFTDVEGAIGDALAQPVDSPPVGHLVKPGDTVCVVFTDITRTSPDWLLVPPILRELEEAGVRDEDITLLCAISGF